jgi:hypothetical protein
MCSDYYSRYKNIISIPLIISSSIMTILNASNFDAESMKYSNVVLNTATALVLSMSSAFKVVEKCSTFRSASIKFTKLTHLIEDKILYNESLDREDVRDIIMQYDAINESIEYTFPESIKKKCIKMYRGNRIMPNPLNCEDFNEMVKNVSVDIKKPDETKEVINSSIVYNRPRIEAKVLDTRPVILDDKSVIA